MTIGYSEMNIEHHAIMRLGETKLIELAAHFTVQSGGGSGGLWNVRERWCLMEFV